MSAENTDRYLVCANIEILEHFALADILAPLWLTETAWIDVNDSAQSAYMAARSCIENAGEEPVSVHDYHRYRGGDLSPSYWVTGPDPIRCQDVMEYGERACKEHVTKELQTPVAWIAGDLESVVLLSSGPIATDPVAEARDLLGDDAVILSTVAGWHLKKAREGASK